MNRPHKPIVADIDLDFGELGYWVDHNSDDEISMSCDSFTTNEQFSNQNPSPNEFQLIRGEDIHTSKPHHFSKTSKSYGRKLRPKLFRGTR
jgi:hypothetical protein